MTAGQIDERVAAAEAAFEAGESERSRTLALEALRDAPDEPRLLRLAGLAALDDGDLEGAVESFRKLLDVQPGDGSTLIHLAHTTLALGRSDEALELLGRAAAADDATSDVLRTLVSLAERSGDTDAALEGAARLLALDPKDVGAALVQADLHLAAGDLDAARADFASLRATDDEDGHEIFAFHGQAEALLRAENWRAALDLAIEATRVDRLQLTTDVLRFASAKLFGEADRSAPPWDEIQDALALERAAHRRMHAEQELL